MEPAMQTLITTLLRDPTTFSPYQLPRHNTSEPANEILAPADIIALPSNIPMYRRAESQEHQVTLHCHNFIEFIYCRAIVDVEYLIGSQRYRLQTGDIIVIPPGVAHCPLLSDSATFQFARDTLWVANDLVKILGYHLPEDFFANSLDAQLLRTAGTKWEFIEGYFRRGIEESRGQLLHWKDCLFGTTLLLLVEISRAIASKEEVLVKEEAPQLFDRILQYIEANLRQRITLEDTAKTFFVSKSTVNRTFQTHVGTSFYRYVTQRRLIAARSLILSGSQLELVGTKVGFADYPTFYRAFKQEYGISPSKFRQKNYALR